MDEVCTENMALIQENKRLTNTVIQQAAEMMKLVAILSSPIAVACEIVEHPLAQHKRIQALEKELEQTKKELVSWEYKYRVLNVNYEALIGKLRRLLGIT